MRFVLLLLLIPLGYVTGQTPKAVPPGPLDELKSADIPRERQLAYAPSELVGILAGKAAIYSQEGTDITYTREILDLDFSPDGKSFAASVRIYEKGERARVAIWIWDLAKPNEKPREYGDAVYSHTKRLTYNDDGTINDWYDNNHSNWNKVGIDGKSIFSLRRLPGYYKVPKKDLTEDTLLESDTDWRWYSMEEQPQFVTSYNGKRLLCWGEHESSRYPPNDPDSFSNADMVLRFCIWDLTDSELKVASEMRRKGMHCHFAALSPDGRTMATADTTMRDAPGKKCRVLNPGRVTEELRLYDLNGNPPRVIATTRVESLASGNETLRRILQPLPYSMVFPPDQSAFLMIAQDYRAVDDENFNVQSLYVYPARNLGKPIRSFRLEGTKAQLYVTPDSSRLVRVHQHYTNDYYVPARIAVAPMKRGIPNMDAEIEIPMKLAPAADPTGYMIHRVAMARDSRHMAVAGADGSILILRLPTFRKN